jgi:hypothetical protein
MPYTATSISIVTTPTPVLNLTKTQRLLRRWEALALEHQVDLISDPILSLPVTTQTLALRLRRQERKAVQP